jgi:uncharacterized protein (DUF1697 family)
MNKYIAILRGINVSGQKKIKMADLKSHLSELNFKNIQTYIQSGNIIFEYESDDIIFLEDAIKSKINEKYGFEVPTIVITQNEIEYVLANNPFINEQGKDPERIYVTFLSDFPSITNIEKLENFNYSPEEYILDGKIIYFFSPHGYGKAKMNNNFFENKLKVEATTRNWKTVNKLFEMMNS